MNQNSEAQNNKLSLNSSVLIKVIRPSGLYIPELKTTVPLMQYSRVDYVIQMLNRGINVEFVNVHTTAFVDSEGGVTSFTVTVAVLVMMTYGSVLAALVFAAVEEGGVTVILQ